MLLDLLFSQQESVTTYLCLQFWRMKWTVMASTNPITALSVKIPDMNVFWEKIPSFLLAHSQSQGQRDRAKAPE